jgi:hypothetical protein
MDSFTITQPNEKTTLRSSYIKTVVRTGSNCEICKFRDYANNNPNSPINKIWEWHTKWCPGWRAYQKELAKWK